MNYKLAVFCGLTAFCLTASFSAAASNTGYYMFLQNRYFGAKLDTETYDHKLEESPACAAKFYPSAAKHLFSYIKNTSRTINENIAYGDWEKPYRIISGFEYDYKRSKPSKSAYGYKDRSGSFFFLTDKAFLQNYLRLGGGAAITRYDSSYDEDMYQKDENIAIVLYLIFNDSPRQIRWRSRLTGGVGKSDIRRRAVSGHTKRTFKDDFHNYFYAWENSLSKTFQKGASYLQPQAEFNLFGLERGKISEPIIDNHGLQIPQNSLLMAESVLTLYAGIKGTDKHQNRYDFKLGPALTYIHSDPYDAFYALRTFDNGPQHFKARRDERDYLTWKAVAKYNFAGGAGLYGDFRYYKKDRDSIAWLLGINYRF